MSFSAAFLDRDGTLIRDPGYLDDPDEVELIDGVPEALSRLSALEIPTIVVTNQSGIGRGYYTEDDFRAVQRELERQLAAHGCGLDGVYHCPHAPESGCGCRKPALGMYRRAAERFGISLSDALYVGDKISDVRPARTAGGTGFLVETGHEADGARLPEGCRTARDLRQAVERALQGDAGPDVAPDDQGPGEVP